MPEEHVEYFAALEDVEIEKVYDAFMPRVTREYTMYELGIKPDTYEELNFN